MMLQNNFYHIISLQQQENAIDVVFEINKAHNIFEGHFPGQPVVPGVCMMQIVKEIIDNVTGKTTMIERADDMKFLAIINPQDNNIIQAAIKYSIEPEQKIKVTATLLKDELVHFKFKGQFQFQ